jgi:putative restriction endonuclease
MHYVILVSQTGQQTYDDSERHYTYPARYNAALTPLMAGEPTVVILYESRRAGSGRGLQAYIGWTVVTRPPEPTGQGLWILTYDSPVVPLPRPVKQEEGGVVMEAWLGAFPLRERGVRQNGLSVRSVTETDAARIFAAAGLLGLTPSAAWTVTDGEETQRRREALDRAVRDRSFRAQVLAAYRWRCAVTGWQAPVDLSGSLLDAADLRSVASGGADHVHNGVALTPTVHRLLDGGLIRVTFEEGRWRTRHGPEFGRLNLIGSGESRLVIEDRAPLWLPPDPRLQPRPLQS